MHEEGLSTEPNGKSLRPGTVLLEFDVIDRIGEGGFSCVYLARDRSLGRTVAIKEYMPFSLVTRAQDDLVTLRSEKYRSTFDAGLRSFINEARLLAQFDHPALLKVYRFWEAKGTAYMAMPYYEGNTLKELMRASPGVVNEDWLLEMLAAITEALEILHGVHCYHRDISPDNIQILTNGMPLLLDFGAARRIIGDMTQGVTVILKPGYAPVEQYSDDSTVPQGPWTDIYALAAVVYFCVTGKAPPASVARAVKDSLVPLEAVAGQSYSAAFLHAIRRSLAVFPTERPQSIAELRALLNLPPTQVPIAPAVGRTPQALTPRGRPAGQTRDPAAQPQGATSQRTATGAPRTEDPPSRGRADGSVSPSPDGAARRHWKRGAHRFAAPVRQPRVRAGAAEGDDRRPGLRRQ